MLTLFSVLAAAAFAAPPQGVTLVLADEATVEAIGSLPTLAQWTQAVEKIQRGKPDAVVLKFFIEEDAPAAKALAKLAAKHKNVYLQAAGVQEGNTPDELGLASAKVTDKGADLEEFPATRMPPAALARAAAGVGIVHVKLDASGAADRWQAAVRIADQPYASLTVLLAARALGLKGPPVVSKEGERVRLVLGARKVDLDFEAAYPIEFSSADSGYAAYSLEDILKGSMDVRVFQRRVVVLGLDHPSEPGLKTKLSASHNKVRLFADALNTLLKKISN